MGGVRRNAASTREELDAARFDLEQATKRKEVVIDRIKAEVKQADARRATAEAELRRIERLAQSGAVSAAELDAARTEVAALRARIQQLADLLGLKTESLDDGAGSLRKAAIDEAEAQRTLANTDYQRAVKLHADKAISRKELEAAEAHLRVAEARLKQLKEAQTPPATPTEQRGSLKQPASARTDTDALGTLDLAERYLRSIADLKKARSRMALMKKNPDSTTQRDLSDGEIELERAERHEKLLARFIQDALNSARAARASAEIEARRAEELRKKGYLSLSDVDAAQARLAETEAKVKQIQSIVDIARPTSEPPTEPGKKP
jgi:multidrug resistance efflux pump